MVKRCIIILRLVKEAEEKKNEELEREIENEVKLLLYRIPWVAEIEVIRVSQE